MSEPLDKGAFALQPFRLVRNRTDYQFYWAMTFPRDPWAGCDMYLRRIGIFNGKHKKLDTDYGVDILSKDNDLLDTFDISRDQFRILRNYLRFKVVRDND